MNCFENRNIGTFFCFEWGKYFLWVVLIVELCLPYIKTFLVL